MGKKVCLITGANSGIGKAAATQLAKEGFKVIIGSRNKKKGANAVEEIRNKSFTNDVELQIIDMSSQNSIKEAADEINVRFDKLDVLIHNAADFDISRKKPVFSIDNIETVWETNIIGPVLLTNLLLDKIKNSEQGRIITIASKGLLMHPFLRINFDDPEFRKSRFSVEKAYYQSKLAQIMYTYWLSEQLKTTGITVNCIRVTNVKIDISRYPDLPPLLNFLYSIKSRFSISPDEMAKTYIYLVNSKELSTVTGRYFDENGKIISSSAYSKNNKNISELMSVVMRYIR